MNLKKLAIAGALAISSVVSAGYAIAATYYTEWAYYSDATYSQQVGERIYYCNARSTGWGERTAYAQRVYTYNCAYPIP